VGVRDFNVSHETNTNWNRLLRDDLAHLLHGRFIQVRVVVLRSELDNLVLEGGVTDTMARNFPVLVHRSDICLLDLKLNLNVRTVKLLSLRRALGSSHDLQRVSHVGRDEELFG